MFKRLLVIAAILVAIIFGLWLASVLPRLAGFGSAPKVYNTATLLKQVQTLSQLVTVKYVMEKIVVLEDPPKNLLGQAFAGESRVLLVAHGIVKAGVDLSELKPADLQVMEKKVVLTLPPSQITDVYLDDKQTKIVERTTGFLRSFDKDLEQTARQNAVDDIRRAARSGGILKDADERAQAQLKNLFKQLGYTVEFRSP
ncbi:MAG: DUF4230 domain-containing protein [Verrucomicrobia bacterium]|nr:DUF4230 domain-containing protein [Verrucomicrobiota bacterium]